MNAESNIYIFNIAGRGGQLVPSKAAGTATWVDSNVLLLNLRFVESIHGDKITCKFDDDTVTLSFKSSLAEITNNNPEKRKDIKGKS